MRERDRNQATPVASTGGVLDGHSRRAIAVVRIAFGVAWGVDATLKWLPGFVHGSFLSTLRDAAMGQPAPVKAWIDVFITGFGTDTSAWAYALAAAETVLAMCLIAGMLTTVTCAFGAWLSLGIWSTAEGLGGPYRNGSTDVSASIIYVMVFALLLATAAGGTWGLDAWLHPRLGRWGWLCSRAPAAHRPAPTRRAHVPGGPSVVDSRAAPHVASGAEPAAPVTDTARASVYVEPRAPGAIDEAWAAEVSGLAEALSMGEQPDAPNVRPDARPPGTDDPAH